ncbi:hypothetical protein GCM10028895_13800 [Pontibacter rugosus]
MPFKDRNILIIGGTSGIGLQTARLLQEKGANVLIASRQQSEEAEALNLEHLPLDVLQFDNTFVDALPEVLHGLVYCPGSINLRPFDRIKPEIFRNEFELNVMGAVQVLQCVMPRLKKADSASVVLFSTVAARVGMPYHTLIATAKGAVQGLTVALAAEYASAQIRVNAIAPPSRIHHWQNHCSVPRRKTKPQASAILWGV